MLWVFLKNRVTEECFLDIREWIVVGLIWFWFRDAGKGRTWKGQKRNYAKYYFEIEAKKILLTVKSSLLSTLITSHHVALLFPQ